MIRLTRLWPALLLLLAAPAARAQTATCIVDLDVGSFTWQLADRTRLEPVLIEDAAGRFGSLDSLLAVGEEATALRDALGAEVLAPIAGQLDELEELAFQPAVVEPVPGRFASFGALNHPAGSPVLLTHGVSLAWPLPLRIPATRTMPDSGALLMSAPFHDGIEPARDDPDTLRNAIGHAAQSVQLIPRNEPGSITLRRALEENSPALWWFRGSAGGVAGLQPAFGVLPAIVIWSLPSHSTGGPPTLTPNTFASGGQGPGCIVVSTRTVAETPLSLTARRLCDGLARGDACGVALREAQEQALKDGQPIALATALIAVGDTRVRGTLRRAPWFRRLGG